MAVLTCHQGLLWITELPLVGTDAAVTYPLRPHPLLQEKVTEGKNATGRKSDGLQEIVIQIALRKNYTDDDPMATAYQNDKLAQHGEFSVKPDDYYENAEEDHIEEDDQS